LAFCQMYVSHIWHVIENSSSCTIYKSCQNKLCKDDHAYLTYVYIMLKRQLSHLNGRNFDHRQVQASLCCSLQGTRRSYFSIT
jgi:hypothetical protein